MQQLPLKWLWWMLSDNKRKSAVCIIRWAYYLPIRKTIRLKSGWGFGQKKCPPPPPLSTARVLIDAVGLCLLRVSEVWWLFAPVLRRWNNSFSDSNFKPRLVYKTWFFVISSQTLASSFKQSNCIYCDKNLLLYCHQNIFCSVATEG